MQFRPCFHQPPLAPWQGTGDQFDWVNAEDSDLTLVVRMEVSYMMR
jgi:hypothetical protein